MKDEYCSSRYRRRSHFHRELLGEWYDGDKKSIVMEQCISLGVEDANAAWTRSAYILPSFSMGSGVIRRWFMLVIWPCLLANIVGDAEANR
jgi:hypothetical protein